MEALLALVIGVLKSITTISSRWPANLRRKKGKSILGRSPFPVLSTARMPVAEPGHVARKIHLVVVGSTRNEVRKLPKTMCAS